MRYLAVIGLAVSFISGCDEEEKATPQAIFDGRLLGNNATCADTGELFRVGDFGNPNAEPPVPSRPVKSGDAEGQGSAEVDCTVAAAGNDEFNVNGTVVVSSITGGTFKIDGKLKASGEAQNIHAIFSTKKTGNTYESRTCTVSYQASYRGVAPGRMWGIIKCAQADNPQTQKTCEADAEFRFENCNQ